jgi:hypothetical protein
MTALGRTGNDIFPLGLGTNTFGWSANESASHEVLDAFVEAGGNFIPSSRPSISIRAAEWLGADWRTRGGS